MNAGLAPAVRSGALSGGRTIERVVLGRCPTEPLQGIRDGRSPLLVVIDQFEQLFTEADAAEQEAFQDRLAALITDPARSIRIVLTLRAGFYDRPLLHPASVASAVGDELAALWRDRILTSMVKHLDTAVVAALTAYTDGTLTAGVRTLGLVEGGVGLATSGGFIDDMHPQLDRLRSRIVDGTIIVPTVPLERGGGAS